MSSPISFSFKGDHSKTKKWLDRLKHRRFMKNIEQYGEWGVQALTDATPKRTGKTAASWSYVIERTSNAVTITWTNSNKNKGENIALLIQMGHGTSKGAYIQGRDYINPALKPIFEQIADAAWKEVTEVE